MKGATTMTDVYENSFQVSEDAELSVSSIAGQIDVRAGEGTEIRIHATKHGSEGSREQTEVEAVQDGNRVTVRTRGGDSGIFGTKRNLCAVDYEIRVPVGCRVEARAVSADIRVAGTQAPVTTESVSGDIQIADASGSCSVTSVSGDVTAERVSGRLTARSTSGDVEVDASRLESFNFNSVSGNVQVESPLAAGEQYFARTVSGDLVLRVPPSTGATIQMKSVSGDVTSDLPAQIIKAGRRHWQGIINGGGAHVELNSVSGDLRIIAVPGEAPTGSAPAPAESRASDVDVSAVLSALESGEIGVEEAMGRIKAMR
jgi:hypothetical protein